MSAVQDCLAGHISPEVAIARLLLGGATAAGIVDALGECRNGDERWAAMRRLATMRADDLNRLAAEVRETAANHSAAGDTPDAGLARIAAFFDRAVAHSPEASVALYSLGDPVILAAATAEIVDWLHGQGLLPRDADVLDLGCGIGRMAGALAPRCRSIHGLDVSAGMVAEARRRHDSVANVQFEVTSGHGLDLPPASLDLVLAVDSFPYIVQAGPDIAARHVSGAAVALRPGGALVVLNLSYRGDPALDRADAAGWAAMAGLELQDHGTPFRVWDGTAFILQRPLASPSPSGRGSG